MSLYSGRNNYQDQYQYGRGDEDQYGGYGPGNNNYGNNNNSDDEDENIGQKGFERRLEGQDDIFMFKKVQLPGITRNQDIKKFIVSQQTKIVITKNNKIYRWRPKLDPQFKLYELPDSNKQNFLGILAGKDKQINIKNVFLDPRGHHCIICCDMGNNFYLNIRQSKIRPLTKLKGVNIKALAFHSTFSDSRSQPKFQLKSGDVVFSSDNAIISILNLEIMQGELLQTVDASVLQLPSQYDILAIQIIRLTQNNGRYLIIWMSTVTTIYCITGPDDINVLFKKFKEPNQRVKQVGLPRGTNSIIKVCYSKINNRATNIFWSNGNTMLLFKVPEQDEKITDNFLSKNQTIKFAKKVDLPLERAYQIGDNPINFGITDFHYYILFQESLTIMSLVTQKIVHYEDFKGMLMSDMVFQQNTGIFWIYEPKGVIKLDTSRESSQAWKLLISQKKYKQAYNVCKVKNQNLSYAAGLYADYLFNKKEYVKAAKLFSETSRTFQEIFLKFIQVNTTAARDGLQIYLYSWLNKVQPQQRTQRCLLISWLVQLIVYDMNNLERQKSSNEGQKGLQTKNKLKQKQADIQKLLDNNLDVINQNLIYLIMMSHGRIQNLINFADKKSNIQMIIIHYLSQESYDKALDYLKNVKDSSKVAEVVYKYSHIFFRFQTQKTVNLLTRSIRDFKPIKLMPGLMNIQVEKRVFGIDLLRYCVQQLRSKEKSLHNILIFFYATSPKQKIPQLIDLMKKGRLDFDLDFGLRLFKNYKIAEAQIIVYGKMYLYSKAVSLALQNNKQELAKQYAQKPDYEDQRKKLWIQIARHYLVKKQKMHEVIQLTKQSKVIKIQDLLPYFNQNIKIENFKTQICDSLKNYSQQINRLKGLMDSYSANADQLKNQLRLIEKRCIEVDSNHKCQQCFKTLFNSEFYIFPCMHGFHKDCLFESVKSQPTFNRYKVQKITVLNDQIKGIKLRINRKREQQKQSGQTGNSLSTFSLMSALNIWSNKKEDDNNYSNIQRQEAELKVKRDQIDSILAAECIYCGPGIVDTITMPFDNNALRQSWKI